MKKGLALIIMFILTNVYVLSFESGVPHNVFEIPVCYNDTMVKIRADGIQNDTYSFLGCSRTGCLGCKDNEEMWVCRCTGNKFNITLSTSSDTINNYDVTVQYYIKPVSVRTGNETQEEVDTENDNNKRVETFTNIGFNIKPPPPEEPVKMPPLSDMWYIIFILGGTMFIIFLLILVVWKWLTKEEIEGEKPKKKKKSKKEVSDEEILKFIDEIGK